MAPFAPANLH